MIDNKNIERRKFLQAAGISAASALLGRKSSEAKPSSAHAHEPIPDKPNVLVMMTDQHRADLMTCAGYLYDALEKDGLLDNTIVVYTSDHGEMDGDHGLSQKFCLFEPSVKVPLIVSYPKHLPDNKVTNALTEPIGLYPTLSELAGLEPPQKTTLHDIPGAPQRMDATSFTSVLRHSELNGPTAAFSEYNLRSQICEYMVRTRRYKYIFNHGSTHELYDHQTDPGEFVNRIDDPALRKVRDQLRDRLFAWYNPEKNPYRQQPKM